MLVKSSLTIRESCLCKELPLYLEIELKRLPVIAIFVFVCAQWVHILLQVYFLQRLKARLSLSVIPMKGKETGTLHQMDHKIRTREWETVEAHQKIKMNFL